MDHPFHGARRTPNVSRKHRMLIQEAILGTVNAYHPVTGVEKYFDYDWDGARNYAMVEQCTDLRVCAVPFGPTYMMPGGGLRRQRQRIALYGVPPVEAKRG